MSSNDNGDGGVENRGCPENNGVITILIDIKDACSPQEEYSYQ